MQIFPKRRGFFDFFPPPQFLSMPSVGIDLSDESIKFFELSGVPNGRVAERFGEENIPSGAILDGSIQDTVAVGKVISAFQKKHDLSFARIACPEKKSYILELSLPLASREALRATVESRFEEYVPLKREESIFDFDVVGVSEKQKTVRVQISAVSMALAEAYETVFRNAGITPIAFEVESQALVRAVVPEGEPKAVLVVDIGKKETTFAIARRGSVWFTASLDVGGETLTRGLSEALRIPFATAEEIKRTQGVLPQPQNKETAEAILRYFQPIEEKMRQYISYKEDTPFLEEKETPIGRILLCGGGSNIPSLAEYLSVALPVQVALANPWGNIVSFDEHIPTMSFGESLRYATAMGLVLPRASVIYEE